MLYTSSPQTVTPTGNTTVSFNYWSNATTWHTFTSTITTMKYFPNTSGFVLFDPPESVFNKSGAVEHRIKFTMEYSMNCTGEFEFSVTLTNYNTMYSGYGYDNWTAQWHQISGPKTLNICTDYNMNGDSEINKIIQNNQANPKYTSGSSAGHVILLCNSTQIHGYFYNSFPIIVVCNGNAASRYFSVSYAY